MKLFKRYLILFICLLLPSSLFAYNFNYTNDDGEPVKWDNNQPIRYYMDPEDERGLTRDQLYILIKEAMKLWEEVPTAKVPRFEFAGYLPENVNEDNYYKYVSDEKCFTEEMLVCDNKEVHESLKTVIVFDSWILRNVLCRIFGCSAEAGPITFEGGPSAGLESIIQGQVVFGAGPAPTSAYVGWLAHEIGHLLGLGHTSLNQQFSPLDIPEETELTFFKPTMRVATSGTPKATLNPDDIAGISTLYPSDTFYEETASIAGNIKKSDGSPMYQVNVIARNIEDPLCKAYSFLSGRFCPNNGMTGWTCLPDGSFTISGLPPGNYTVEVEEVEKSSSTGVSLNAQLAGDAEFWNEGDQASEDPYIYTVLHLEAGDVVENVDIILNRSEVTNDRIKFIPPEMFSIPETTSCTDSTVDYAGMIGIEEDSDDDSSSGAGGGCSLIIR